MTRETQIGLTLVLVLCGVFGFFVYKKVHEPTAAIATANPNDDAKQPETPAPETPAAVEPRQPEPAGQPPLVAGANDLLNVEPAAATRLLPETPTGSNPRVPVEPKAQSLPDDAFGGPAPKVAAAPPARPKLPTLIPDDEGDAFGAPRQPAEPETVASRSSGAMEVTSATIPDDGDDPFGEPAASSQPNARPKLPAVTGDSFSAPAGQLAPEESDPFGAPAASVALGSPETAEQPSASPARDDFGSDAPPASLKQPSASNPVRLSLPVAEESDADPFGAREPKTASAAPATLGEPEFDSKPVARPAPMLNLPTDVDTNRPDGFEPPIQLQQPEPVELAQNTSVADDPYGSATAESKTEVQRSEPAMESVSPRREDADFGSPEQIVVEPKGTIPRPAPTLPLEDQEEFPAVRRTQPAVTPAPRPVAIDLPKAGAITQDQHVVEPNQNFWTLAQRRYGAGRYSEALAAHNKQTVPDPTHIKPGTIVSLPPAEVLEQQFPDLIPKTAAPQVDPKSVVAGPGQYVIQDGDSFWKISKKVYGDPRYWDALQKHNSETSKLPALKPGTIISTPPVAALEQKFANLITAPAAKATTPPGVALREPAAAGDAGLFEAADGQPLYRVGQGDTLSSIARSTLGRSSRWVQILHLNRETLKDGNDLTPGTVLRMPADATQVQMSSLERDRR